MRGFAFASNMCSNMDVRVTDPFRLAVAALIGCAWRMSAAGVSDEAAVAELRLAGASAREGFPRACADAAVFWRGRADEGMVDRERARRAVARLARLATDEAGRPVAPSPREISVTEREE